MAELGTLNGGLGKWRIWGFSGENDDFFVKIGEVREKNTQNRQKTAKKHQKTSKIVRNLAHHDCIPRLIYSNSKHSCNHLVNIL